MSILQAFKWVHCIGTKQNKRVLYPSRKAASWAAEHHRFHLPKMVSTPPPQPWHTSRACQIKEVCGFPWIAHTTMSKYRKCQRKVLLKAALSSQVMQLGKGYFWSMEKTENRNTTYLFSRIQTCFCCTQKCGWRTPSLITTMEGANPRVPQEPSVYEEEGKRGCTVV